jgi:hypothetical protein
MGEFDRAEAGYRAALTLAPGDPASLQGLNLAILRGRPADHRQTPQAGR